MNVVSGVAIRDGLVLMGKRRFDRLRPGLWELPGGKIEDDERSTDALVREWREEIGVEVTVDPALISSCRFDLEDAIGVELYRVVLADLAEPRALDHDELMWCHPTAAARHLPCSPGFYLHYADLKEHMVALSAWVPAPFQAFRHQVDLASVFRTPPIGMDAVNHEYVRWMLARHGGNKSRAARALGIDRRSLYRWLAKPTGTHASDPSAVAE